jgi:UPF0042 nucleotide-binding protein
MTQPVIILTGQSGSGKTTAMQALEDRGYLCIDNAPLDAVGAFLDTSLGCGLHELVIGLNVRRLSNHSATPAQVFTGLCQRARRPYLVYLEARDEVLEQRFSATRRRHPLEEDGDLGAAISLERHMLAPLRELADRTIDTTLLTPYQLRRQVQAEWTGEEELPPLQVGLVSFGFRFGVPMNVDLLFDVRFLPNPYFVEGLRDGTGLDAAVAAYVVDSGAGGHFLQRTADYIQCLFPGYHGEGRRYLTIAIGCTGGRHRSVAIAEALAKRLRAPCHVRHRDVGGGQ